MKERKERYRSGTLERLRASITDESYNETRDRMLMAISLEKLRQEKELSVLEFAKLWNVSEEDMIEMLAGNLDFPGNIKEFFEHIFE